MKILTKRSAVEAVELRNITILSSLPPERALPEWIRAARKADPSSKGEGAFFKKPRRHCDLIQVRGELLLPAATYFPKTRTQETMSQLGYPVQIVHEINSARLFRTAILAAKKSTQWGACVFVYDENDYDDMRLFLADDAATGFAIKSDGDLVSVFGNADVNPKNNRLAQCVVLAVENGACKLDAFDTVLPNLYARFGFREVQRLSWDDTQAPQGWDKKLYAPYSGGEPDVVFMVYDSSEADTLLTLGAAEDIADGEKITGCV